jgi:drug/metabolite transporter (DMT)-like permease
MRSRRGQKDDPVTTNHHHHHHYHSKKRSILPVIEPPPAAIVQNKSQQPLPQTISKIMSTTFTHFSSSSSRWLSIVIASIYVLSGATQPLLMTLVKSAGLGDPTCQVYMLFYYIGPTMVVFSLCCPSKNVSGTTRMTTSPSTSSGNNNDNINNNSPASKNLILKASSIALIDIIAQSMNYTGSTMAGPTIFAIIYSSVTVWTALYSYVLLSRKLSIFQWGGVIIVFFGLVITSINSVSVGQHVFNGTILILIGSSLHALTYVLSEIIMTQQKLSLQLNCSIQAIVACTLYFLWQMIYTKKYYHEKIEIPMIESGTTIQVALMILFSLSLSNLIHATSFFYTLKYFPGGATSAGVMKGLQAVLVFVFSSLVYCTTGEFHGSNEIGEGDKEKLYGGEEMCFTYIKFVSLVVVLTGVILFAVATDGLVLMNDGRNNSNDNNMSLPPRARKQGYQQIESVHDKHDNEQQNVRIT